MSHHQSARPYTLGLDLGSNSLGWAVIGMDGGLPSELIDCGARIFEAGLDNMENARDEPRGAKRRSARQQRRQTERRARRLARIWNLLASFDLLPRVAGETFQDRAVNRGKELERIDADLRHDWAGRVSEAALTQTLPYNLRALALDQDLPRLAAGRALFHLAQRRGFDSSRKEKAKNEEEAGKVKAGISELERLITETGARTLGEYFARLDPIAGPKIRGRWTSRHMYLREFDLIWESQARFSPDVFTPERKEHLHRAVFYQRPLKSSAHLVGKCELEPLHRRAPVSSLLAQRFRILQTVNHLAVLDRESLASRELTPEERVVVLRYFESNETVTWVKLRKALGLKKGLTFNLENGDSKSAPGNRTVIRLEAIFGERWNELPRGTQHEIAGAVRAIDRKDELAQLASRCWGLNAEQAAKLAELHLEEGYASLSRRAMSKLLPLMETGTPYSTARATLYGAIRRSEPVDYLPPVGRLGTVRNPAVNRSLTELRKVVNAIIRKYGKPEEIHVELARELRKSRKDREQIYTRQRKRESHREEIKRQIREQCGITAPSGADIEKALLWEECGGICPYTGHSIGFTQLFGANCQFEIEHIIPRSISFDDSFLNKTLCHVTANRRKGNRTPFEAFGANTEEWEGILERVKRFSHSGFNQKLALFLKQGGEDELFQEFTTRQLNDTKYASRLAADYLGELYGARIDASGTQRIYCVTGGVTAALRRGWDLHRILSDGPRKSRDDHRHHALDAIVIALTGPRMMSQLSEDVVRAIREGKRRFAPPGPWPDFGLRVREAIDAVIISHRPEHRMRGALHKGTLYGAPRPGFAEKDEPAKVVHVRKTITELTLPMITKIVDPAVRRAVEKKLEEIGGDLKRFADPKNPPAMVARDGRVIPIYRVRIRDAESTFRVGGLGRERNVVNENNHHIALYETVGKNGLVKWTADVVSLMEAVRRHWAGESVIRKTLGDGTGRYLFALMRGDAIALRPPGEAESYWVVRGFSRYGSGQIVLTFARNHEGRENKLIIGSPDWLRPGPDQVRTMSGRPVCIDLLGKVVSHARENH